MAVKRRVIWMSDEHWALLVDRAERRQQTISALLRDCATGGESNKKPMQEVGRVARAG